MSDQLAAFPHDALWMTKRTIQRAASLSPAEALEMAGDASLVCACTPSAPEAQSQRKG